MQFPQTVLRRLPLALFVPWLIAACGQIYSTKNTYTAPDSVSTRECVRDCKAETQDCVDRTERRYRMCEREDEEQAEDAFRRYRRAREEQKLPLKKSIWDFKSMGCSSYQTEYKSRCEAHYDDCFTDCGGRITPKRECVMFCEE
ncbi:hypothetical protein GGE65_006979 [Skermanella aerolata]|uniref:hypothetical protein n=1 Tax=Skermanella aerolata TaxID=393310 RepID=UPI003D1AE2F1